MLIESSRTCGMFSHVLRRFGERLFGHVPLEDQEVE